MIDTITSLLKRLQADSDNKELEELKSRIELEERTIEEIRNALQKRLSEKEEKSRQYEKEEKIKREILQKEIEEKRKAAKQEIERYQAEQTDMLKKRIQDFGSQYHLYLSKIYQASEMLNNTALQIGNTFLENDTNISELFRVQTKDSLGNLTLGKEHPNPDLLFYKLLYQAISRAREKLCVLIVENYKLFSDILYANRA